MKRFTIALLIVLLAASPRFAAAQQVAPFAPNRFDHLLTGSQVRVAASAGYGGNSVDLLAITSTARILNEFMATDVLLIGGLVPGRGNVELGARGAAGVFTAIAAGAWHMSVSAEAGSYAAVHLPAAAANLLRQGNVENTTIDTRNLFASGLVTREIGLAAARRIALNDLAFAFGANARHVAPIVFATGRIDPLHDGPALNINNDNISAQADVVHADGRADGGGYAFDLHAEVITRGVTASLTLSDLGNVRVDYRTLHRAVNVQNMSIEDFVQHIDGTVTTQSNESRKLTLPGRIDARVSAAINPQFSGGMFLHHQYAGDLGAAESALGATLGWDPGNIGYLRS